MDLKNIMGNCDEFPEYMNFNFKDVIERLRLCDYFSFGKVYIGWWLAHNFDTWCNIIVWKERDEKRIIRRFKRRVKEKYDKRLYVITYSC